MLFVITMELQPEKLMTSSWHKDFRDGRKSWHDSNPEVKKKWQAKDFFFVIYLFVPNQTKLATKDK